MWEIGFPNKMCTASFPCPSSNAWLVTLITAKSCSLKMNLGTVSGAVWPVRSSDSFISLSRNSPTLQRAPWQSYTPRILIPQTTCLSNTVIKFLIMLVCPDQRSQNLYLLELFMIQNKQGGIILAQLSLTSFTHGVKTAFSHETAGVPPTLQDDES